MEKTKGTVERTIILVNILSLFVLLATLYFAFQFHRSLKDTENRMIILEDKISEAERQTDLLSSSLMEKQKEMDSYQEFEKKISDERNAYYQDIIDLEQKILNGQTKQKIAYLTFDDGPYRLSERFLDVLDDYNVKATFFYLMKCTETGFDEEYSEVYDRVYRRIIASGHTLANHTASHKLGEEGVYQSVDYFMSDLLKNRDFIRNRYGYETTIMRFPGGSQTSSMAPAIKERLPDLNYVYVDWNVMCGDGGKKVLSPETYTANILNDTEGKDILVVLMHDYSENTLIALPDIITGLRKQGYILLPLCDRSSMCH